MSATTKTDSAIRKRKTKFVSKTTTCIWHEQPTKHNPYLAEVCRCHGYDLLDLVHNVRFVEALYLLFLGELPTKEQAKLLETLMVALINPGPRHPAVRAAMVTGNGRTSASHILPISLSILSGDHLGGDEVVAAMHFFNKHQQDDPEEIASNQLTISKPPGAGDWHPIPGFGCRFGGIDPLPQKIASICCGLPASGTALRWGTKVAAFLETKNMGWLSTGLAAAVFCDLGFPPRTGSGIFQLFCAPGLLAHGLEIANKPITAMPFLDDDHYIIADGPQKK